MAVAKKTTAAKGGVKKSINDLEIDITKNYEFNLVPKGGKQHEGKYVLPKKSITWDESEEKFRYIQLCDGEESPYVDDHKDTATVSKRSIVFDKGKLVVPGTLTHVIRYLLAFDGNADKTITHPSNRNLSFKYRLKDKEELFRKSASEIKLELKAQNLIAEASAEEIETFLGAYYDYTPQTETEDELLVIALKKAEQNPAFVVKNFKSEEQSMRYKIFAGFKNGILANNKGTVTWKSTGKEVGKFTATKGQLITDMVEWVFKKSDDAVKFAELLTKEVAIL